MDARHTPGPFEARDDHSAIGVGDMTLARVYWGEGRTPEEDIANARLFAAAPDLLAACEAAVGAFDLAVVMGSTVWLGPDIDRMKAAIAKAKGE